MFKRLKNLLPSGLLRLGIGMAALTLNTAAQAQEVAMLENAKPIAFASPHEDFVWYYPLEHNYETTLFRSERFDPLMETPEGYIVLMTLGGEPKLVVLPFQKGERKVAELKFNNIVGVTYTAYLDFDQGSLPIYKDQYYPILEDNGDSIVIDYQLKEFRKRLTIPKNRFIVKSAFEHKLEEKLKLLRGQYLTTSFERSNPTQWTPATRYIGTSPQPTHLALTETPTFAIDPSSEQTLDVADISNALLQDTVDGQSIKVLPIIFSLEANDSLHHFISIEGQDRPALIKSITAKPESDNYSKIVRIQYADGQSARLLEITDSNEISIIANTHLFKKEELLLANQQGEQAQLISSAGNFEPLAGEIEFYTPERFIKQWASKLKDSSIDPDSPLWQAFTSMNLEGDRFDFNWESLKALQSISKDWSTFRKFNKQGDLAGQIKALIQLEKTAEGLGIELDKLTNPHLDSNIVGIFRQYWKEAYRRALYTASKQKDYNSLNRLLLRARILTEALKNQELVNFLSEQVYTYLNLMPKPLGRISLVELSPPLEASSLAVFDVIPEDAFKVQSDIPDFNLASFRQEEVRKHLYYLNPTISDKALAPIARWHQELLDHLREVSSPAHWKTSEETAPEAVNTADDSTPERQSDNPNSSIILSPSLAVLGWMIMITLVNGGFLILSKMRPTTILSSPASS